MCTDPRRIHLCGNFVMFKPKVLDCVVFNYNPECAIKEELYTFYRSLFINHIDVWQYPIYGVHKHGQI